ncbi:MAG: AraC family transcriptional regulator [Bacteroidia bacterium]|nr:AraC family transcriptional regulator [Bacteroidia bacterium]
MDRSHFKNKTKGLAIKYVIKGKENYCFDGQEVPVCPGQFIILPYRKSYEAFTSNHKGENLGICIDLNVELVNGLCPESLELDFIHGLPFSGDQFLGISKALASLENGSQALILEEMYGHLRDFHAEMSIVKRALETKLKKLSSQKEAIKRLLEVKNFIHLNFTRNLSLELLGKQVGMSQYNLNRLFTLSFGYSPHELQVKLKMEHAQHLLSQELSLSQIALELGYKELAAFSRQYKKYWRHTPSAFRKGL